MSKGETKVNEKERSWRGCYGSRGTYSELVDFLGWNFAQNELAEQGGTNRFATCIWGHSGIGKTDIVKQHARKPVEWRGTMYDGYQVYDVPIAMFEEMGDLHGMPERHVKACKENGVGDLEMWVPEILTQQYVKEGWAIDHRAGTRTLYAQPDWVPANEGPSILLFDDWNRASVRIIKGIMQLLQNYRMVSWGLPDGCNIVLTANPDEQDYLVTSLDDAILSRIRHITLKEDAKEWAIWAEAQNLDSRGINFVLSYPEMMIGKSRTNPRTLSEFFRFLKDIPDVNDKIQHRKAEMLALSLLDEETVNTMLVFMSREVEMIVEPEQILSGDRAAFKHLKDLMTRKEKRVDVVGVVCHRLFAYMLKPDIEVTDEMCGNFQKFITMKELEDDMRHNLCMRIARENSPRMQQWLLHNDLLKKMIMDVV